MSILSAPKINLLSKRKAAFDQQSELALKVRVGAGVVLVLYVILLLIIVGVNLFVKNQTETIQATVDQTKMQLAAKALLIREQELLVHRSTVIQNLMASRRESIDLWKKAHQLVPDGCEMTLFSLDGSVLRMGIKAPQVLLANKATDVIEKDFTLVGAKTMMASISRGEDASYQIDMELALPQASKGK